MYTENELLTFLWENSRKRLEGGAAGATTSISASCATDIWNKFKNSRRVCYSISAAVSANNCGIDATLDETTWFRLLTVSGLGVTSGYNECPYTNYRGFMDTYSSGTAYFDFIQNK